MQAAWLVVICFSVIAFFNGWTSFQGKHVDFCEERLLITCLV